MALRRDQEERLSFLRIERNALKRKHDALERELSDYLRILQEMIEGGEEPLTVNAQFEKTTAVLARGCAERLKSLELQYKDLQIRRGASSPELLADDHTEFEYQQRKVLEDYYRDAYAVARVVETHRSRYKP